MAEELREQGNSHFKAGNFLKAAAVYTQAIRLDPTNSTLFSNRSAAFLSLLKVTKALSDAEMTVKLKPTWEKGYFRKGCALEAMERYEEALAAYREALEQNPQSSEVSSKIKRLSQLVRDKKRKTTKTNGASHGSTTSLILEKLKADFGDSQRDQALFKFAKEIIESAIKEWTENRKLSASVRFCNVGAARPASAEVQIPQAFESPDTVSNCASFLRQQAVDTASESACVVVSKSSIAFPQVWKGQGCRTWKHSQSDGFFVQLEAASFRKAWFISSCLEKGQTLCRDIESLDVDLHAVMPPLFR